MTTNFFQLLDSLYTAGRWSITIDKAEVGKMSVTVLILDCKPTDDRKNVKARKTMNFREVPEKLDEGFFTALVEPVRETAEMFINREQYAKQLKEEKAESTKAPKGNVSKEQREKEDRKRKFGEVLEKVKKLEADNKYGEAIGLMPKPEDFPEHSDEIKQKLDDLWAKRNSPTLW